EMDRGSGAVPGPGVRPRPPPKGDRPFPPRRRPPQRARPAVDIGDAVHAQRARAYRGHPGIGIGAAQRQRAGPTLGQTSAAADHPRNAHAVVIGVDQARARQRHTAPAGRTSPPPRTSPPSTSPPCAPPPPSTLAMLFTLSVPALIVVPPV